MNKGFFVAVLGVVLGAMVLIFVNQASNSGSPSAVASGAVSSSAPARSQASRAEASRGGTSAPARIQDGPSTQASARPSAHPGQTGRLPASRDAAPAIQPGRTGSQAGHTGSQAGHTGSQAQTPPRQTPPLTAPSRETTATSAGTTPPASSGAHASAAELPAPSSPANARAESVAENGAAASALPREAATQQATGEPARATAAPATSPARTHEAPRTAPQPVAEPAIPSRRGMLTLRNIGLHFKGNGMVLRLEADAPFTYKAFALPSPHRYVVDLAGKWNGMRAPSVPANNIVKSVRVGRQAGGPRMVLDLQRKLKAHDVVKVSPTVVEFRIE